MPDSTKASYVGRLAPPGEPKTTATPSARRHSITAYTARIMRASLSAVDRGFRRDDLVRILELGAAAGAERVVDLHDLAAAGALAPQLVAVGAVEHQRDQPEHRQDRRDQEPQEHRRALDPRDDGAGDAEPQAEQEVYHLLEG